MKSSKASKLVLAAFLLEFSSVAVATANAASVDDESEARIESNMDAEPGATSGL